MNIYNEITLIIVCFNSYNLIQKNLSEISKFKTKDFLARSEVNSDLHKYSLNLRNEVVAVTGAGGSIGAELCLQLLDLGVKKLILLDNHEFSLFKIFKRLERKYKIDEAIKMLDKAYSQKKDDPYIIDSVGWGYYLIGDYSNAEKYIKKAVILMPDDPIVNDHYGDILWMLDRKLQAKYFWENVLNLDTAEDEIKKKIKDKLINGLNKL